MNLKAKAHHLKPIILIGKNGITESVIQEIDGALYAHELIKIKFKRQRSNSWNKTTQNGFHHSKQNW